MLEVRNLSKVYKTKGNNDTIALNDVSLQFPDKGMIFLLGKSGSGKSTLLNLVGGLDNATSGEIIVKGKSSSTFKGSDFDSYRNTFIGFIFQEYNILNEFTVEDNIALALELQGKPKDKERINELLEQVDLANYAKRKPNTLSGGQKQRIAIARALIKDPEIIMADEPTGALDSNTGRQVLETLKKLSETKLVIIVSHDRDFAEIYANRIIELKDGKIISDVTKSAVSAKQIGNVSFVDDNTLSIKDGSKLEKEDLEVVNNYLLKSNSEIIITNSSRDITIFKQNTGITSEGRESFSDTDTENIEVQKYNGNDTKFIKSRLPVKHAAKMGTSSLKLKPFRLVFTILLSSIAFILLGIVSTLMFYNYDNIVATSISESDIDYISVSKGYKYKYVYDGEETSYTDTQTTNYTEKDVEALRQKYGSLITIYNFSQNSKIGYSSNNSMTFENVTIPSGKQNYYMTSSVGFATGFSKSGLNLIAGKEPANSNEVLISSYTYDCIKNGTLKSTSNPSDSITINSYNDLIGKTLVVNVLNKELTVSGIYDVDAFIPQKFAALKENSSSYNNDTWYWQRELQNGIYAAVFVTDSFYTDNLAMANYSKQVGTSIPMVLIDDFANLYSISTINDVEVYNSSGTKITNINQNEFAFSARSYGNNLSKLVNQKITEENEKGDYSFFDGWSNGGENSYQQKLEWFTNGTKYVTEYDGLGNVTGEKTITLSNAERLSAFVEVMNYLNTKGLTIPASYQVSQDENGINDNMNLVGFTFDSDEIFVVNESRIEAFSYQRKSGSVEYKTNYKVDTDGIYTCILIKNSHDFESVKSMVKELNLVGEDDSCYVINCYLMSSLELVNSLAETFTKVFLWVGIVLSVFATLLLFNFISMSITNKKKEIGILRAVGARGMDVFKIFFSESLIIVAICAVIAVIGSAIICNVANAKIAEALSGVRIFVFGFGSIGIIIGLALLVSILSTFLPVYRFAKKKPVDSIRAL